MARNSASDLESAGAVDAGKESLLVTTVAALWPPWGSFAIASLLLIIASAAIIMNRADTMAGAIIGYVAAYWLPPERHP